MAYMSLRGKFIFALALSCLLVLLPALLMGWQLADRVRAHFGKAYADNLTLLNRQKILTPIAIDLALSMRLANSEVTRQWLRDESDPAHRDLFFREVEGYRQDLRDHAYFIASSRTGNYYFNDMDNPLSEEPRYRLNPDDPADSWFYASLQNQQPYNINVNPDTKLGVTRVWMNVRIRDRGEILGVAGASVDLTEFLSALTSSAVSGVMPVVIDAHGAIQAHADTERIAFNSGATGLQTAHTVFGGLAAKDAQILTSAMEQARKAPDVAHSVAMNFEGHPQLLSMAYVPELDWYVLTAVDPAAAQVINTQWMSAVAAGMVVLLLALLAAFGYGVERIVLRPIRRLQQSARAIADGNYDVALPARSEDEIGDLSRAFGEMAAQVGAHTATLEQRVRERTNELVAANKTMALAQKKIGDSIDYASLIQRAILPDRQLSQFLGERHFVLWRPRDVVGGDFYIFRTDGDNSLLGLMDCAGHGVPGALMTMLARAALDLAIQGVGLDDPAAILTRCDSAMRSMLAESELAGALATNADAALVYVEPGTRRLRFAGARLSLYASDGKQVMQYRGSRRALVDKRIGNYENTELVLTPGWTYYLVTDGFLDQAGGEHGFGFGDQRFRTMLAEHAALPMQSQPAVFSKVLAQYQGDHTQRDDITMLSFRFE